MKFRLLRHPAILAGLALIALPVNARADLYVTLTEGNVTTGRVLVASGSPTPGLSYNAPDRTFQDFSFTGASMSEIQTSLESRVLSSTLSLTNNASSNRTLNIIFEATGFTAPTAPPGALLVSNLGGTTPSVGSGAGNAITFQSRAGTSPANATSPQSPDITANNDGYNAETARLAIATGLSAPYSVFQFYTISLNSNATLQFTGRSNLTATPEPGTLAMIAAGLPVVGYGVLRRRKRIVS